MPSPDSTENTVATVQAQERQTIVISLVLSLLILALIAGILILIVLPTITKDVPVLVSYSAPKEPKEKINPTKKVKAVAKPEMPSMQQSRVIAANTASPLAIPIPEIELSESEVSLEFGSDGDFDMGWESDAAATQGGVTFFNQEVVAQRVVYVIDVSNSMKGKRQELMVEEMSKSLKQLQPPLQYQVVFFAGPAWAAGNRMRGAVRDGEVVIVDENGSYEWQGEPSRGSSKNWEQKGDKQQFPWITLDSKTRRNSIRDVQSQETKAGGEWAPPLRMVLEMDPPPEIVFFMTDGVGGATQDILDEISKLARRKKAIINTVSLMEPQAISGLIHLARETRGQFTIVNEKGEAEVQELDD